MPALDGIEIKYRNNLAVHKENSQVWYNDDLHKYYDKEDDSVYVSCTQLIHHYVPEYDEQWWSKYKALERLSKDEFFKYKSQLLQTHKITNEILSSLDLTEEQLLEEQQVVLKEWEDKKNESCARGQRIHKEWEDMFYENKNEPVKQFGIGGKLPCYKGNWELSEHGVFPEFLLSAKSKDGFLRISGQADLIICDSGEVTIIDHKTNAKIDKKGYFNSKTKKTECLKFPLNHIPNASFWIYTLQMSVYGYLIEHNYPNLKVKRLILNHIDHDGNQTLYDCEYLKDDVERLLKHFKKQQKIHEELERIRPIQIC